MKRKGRKPKRAWLRRNEMSNYSINYDYSKQTGGIIINPLDDGNEFDYIIMTETDHTTGTITYTMDVFEGGQIYKRKVFDTTEWKAQAMHEMEQLARERHPEAEIYIHEDDSKEGWDTQ